MSKASEYAKAWAAIKCRAMTDAPALVALKSGIPGDLPLACVTRTGDLLTHPGDIKAKHIPALIAWLTDTFTEREA